MICKRRHNSTKEKNELPDGNSHRYLWTPNLYYTYCLIVCVHQRNNTKYLYFHHFIHRMIKIKAINQPRQLITPDWRVKTFFCHSIRTLIWEQCIEWTQRRLSHLICSRWWTQWSNWTLLRSPFVLVYEAWHLHSSHFCL